MGFERLGLLRNPETARNQWIWGLSITLITQTKSRGWPNGRGDPWPNGRGERHVVGQLVQGGQRQELNRLVVTFRRRHSCRNRPAWMNSHVCSSCSTTGHTRERTG